jgi:hypothetical protein
MQSTLAGGRERERNVARPARIEAEVKNVVRPARTRPDGWIRSRTDDERDRRVDHVLAGFEDPTL